MNIFVMIVLPYYGYRLRILWVLRRLSRTMRRRAIGFVRWLDNIEAHAYTFAVVRRLARRGTTNCPGTLARDFIGTAVLMPNHRTARDYCLTLILQVREYIHRHQGRFYVFHHRQHNERLERLRYCDNRLYYAVEWFGDREVIGLIVDFTNRGRYFMRLRAILQGFQGVFLSDVQ